MIEFHKSSFSSSDGCVEVGFKSASGCNADGCVEVKLTNGAYVRDTKLGADSPVLFYGRSAWDIIIDAVKRGLDCAMWGNELLYVRSANGHSHFIGADVDGNRHYLHFNEVETTAFDRGVLAGEFEFPKSRTLLASV